MNDHSSSPVEDPQADFAQIETLFSALAACSEGERHAALRQVADIAIRDRVSALLAAHDRLKLNERDDDAFESTTLASGDTVGAYRLLDKVGAGGMGEVFRAERADGVFTQQVAVKITRANVAQPDLLRRFAVERQILASLNHPNIVGLLDGGATAAGQAYLIMEYVDGQPLTHYAHTHALGLEARLQLFSAVCTAVQHAHQHGIVHRDLKPANVIVGDDGVPKVVDFGIAKLLEGPQGQQATTAMWPGPMTPNYASPEQLRGLPVTTACDVYALGVMLYELLGGTRPYETAAQTLDRVLEMVVHEEPKRPSDAPHAHAVTLPYPRQRLRGDLDAIVLKAMSKDPAARYASAGELAADLHRWLSGDPVIARARSTAYVLRRLAARHRALVATAAIAVVAVLSALGVAAWQWQAARAAQLRAEQRLRDVRQLANALIFKIQDAVTPLPGSTPVRRTIVDEAVRYLERLEADAANDPTLRLELATAHRQLGNVLGSPSVPNLGDRKGAIEQYERGRALIAPLVGRHDTFEVTAAFVHNSTALASLYSGSGDRQKGLVLAQEAIDHVTAFREKHPRERRVELLVGQALFSGALNAPEESAIALWQRTLEHYETMLAAEPNDPQLQRNVALAGKYLGARFEDRDDHAAARQHYERALSLDAARLKATPDRRDVQFDAAISYSNLASVAEALGDSESAAPLFEQSIALRRRVHESDPADVQGIGRLAYVLWRAAVFYRGIGDHPRAIALARESVQRLDALYTSTNDRQHAIEFGIALYQSALTELAAGDTGRGCGAAARLARLTRGWTEKYGSDFVTRLSQNTGEAIKGCSQAAR